MQGFFSLKWYCSTESHGSAVSFLVVSIEHSFFIELSMHRWVDIIASIAQCHPATRYMLLCVCDSWGLYKSDVKYCSRNRVYEGSRTSDLQNWYSLALQNAEWPSNKMMSCFKCLMTWRWIGIYMEDNKCNPWPYSKNTSRDILAIWDRWPCDSH